MHLSSETWLVWLFSGGSEDKRANGLSCSANEGWSPWCLVQYKLR